jgi:putative phosphoesterase
MVVGMRVAVLADTHVRAVGATALPDAVWDLIAGCDMIAHCGDIVSKEFLDELSAVKPVLAVRGNNDIDLVGVLPEELRVEIDGVRVAVVHDAGPARGRARRMARRFGNDDVVLFGHSHAPVNEPGIDGQLLFNPGSATQRRRQPHRTAGVLHVQSGRLLAHDIVVVDGR